MAPCTNCNRPYPRTHMGASVSTNSVALQTIIKNAVENNCEMTEVSKIQRNCDIKTTDCHDVVVDCSVNVGQGLSCNMSTIIDNAANFLVSQDATAKAGLGIADTNNFADIKTAIETTINDKCKPEAIQETIANVKWECETSYDVKVISPVNVDQQALCAAAAFIKNTTDTKTDQKGDSEGWQPSLGALVGIIIGALVLVAIVVVVIMVIKKNNDAKAAAGAGGASGSGMSSALKGAAAFTPQGRIASAAGLLNGGVRAPLHRPAPQFRL